MAKKRKGRQLPSPRELDSGRWFVRVTVNGVQHCITRDTEEECIQEAAALKFGMKTPHLAPKDKTLRELCAEWIADAEAHKNGKKLSPSTIAAYDSYMNNWAQDIMDIAVAKITPARWQRSIDKSLEKLAPKTVSNAYRWFFQVVKNKTNIQVDAVIPAPKCKKRGFLNYEQIQTFVQAIKGHDLEIPILLAISSLRRSEIYAVTWDKIDLKNNRIRVEGAVVRNKSGKYVRKEENKTEKSSRTIPIIEPLREALEAVPESQRTGIVCKTAKSTLSKRIQTVLRHAGLPKRTCHELRHSFASLCWHLNVQPELAAEMGGWKDLNTMRKIYTHIAEQDKDHFESEFTNFFKQ